MKKFEKVWDKAKEFPVVEDPCSYEWARIWNCNYSTLDRLRDFTSLKKLEILSYPDENLDFLSDLNALEHLQIVHLPNVTKLDPLQHLYKLSYLELSTLPSWDSSGKKTVVESIYPISQLSSLQVLHLFGVINPDRSLEQLFVMKQLKKARFNKWPKSEINKFYKATGISPPPPPRIIRHTN